MKTRMMATVAGVVALAAGWGGQASAQDAQQALQQLAMVRQQQCQSGNQLACQALQQQIPAIHQQLQQLSQACNSADPQACEQYQSLGQRLAADAAESQQVMQAGAAGEAQMNGWRGQMNANAAQSLQNLQAQGEAGQRAHQNRQEIYGMQNETWRNTQEMGERTTGRFNDYVYEGTTMDGQGVQTRAPYGQTAYTDGNGNVVYGPAGGDAPDGWQEMSPTYEVPE